MVCFGLVAGVLFGICCVGFGVFAAFGVWGLFDCALWLLRVNCVGVGFGVVCLGWLLAVDCVICSFVFVWLMRLFGCCCCFGSFA